MTYSVYAIIYDPPKGDTVCVAVSAETRKQAITRLVKNRPANVRKAWQVVGRIPEWNQDRIEGTYDIMDPCRAPPAAGSQEAENLHYSNSRLIEHMLRTHEPSHGEK